MDRDAIHEMLERAAIDSAGLRSRARLMLIEAAADAKQLGLSQREIAHHIGRSQPEVSRLIGLATPRFMPRTELGRYLVSKRREVIAAVESEGAWNVRVFGSVARGTDGPESDIDLLIDMPDDFSLFGLGGVQVAVEKVLKHPVDVIPARGLKGSIKSSALQDAVLL